MKDDCIFCKIANGIIPVKPIMENQYVTAIADKNPIAPFHVLVMPKEHFGDLGDLMPCDPVLHSLFIMIDDVVSQSGLDQTGYRVVTNTGKHAGQTVKHLHFHILGGAELDNKFGAKVDTIKLYLDDDRETPEGWLRVYGITQAKAILMTKRVTHLSVDNDLGNTDPATEGYNLLNWLEGVVHDDPTFPVPIITVHSANAGRAPSMRQTADKLELIRQQQVGGQ